MTWQEIYAARRLTAAEAANRIESGWRVAMGMALAEPPAILAAIAARAAADEIDEVKLFYFHSTPHAGSTVLRYDLMDRIRPHCFFLGPIERALLEQGAAEGRRTIDFVPGAFSQAPRLMTDPAPIDAYVATVSPMDRHGYFSLGTSNDYGSAVARSARQVIVEVNRHMPRVRGGMIHVSEVHGIVEHDLPLFENPNRPPAPEDEAIGRIVAGLVDDGACLQMGIGALPDAICAALNQHRDLGVHTELLSPGLVALMRSGAVTNGRKTTDPGLTIFTFALGDQALYDFIDDNAAVESRPVAYVNDPAVIARNDRVVSVNATLQVDLSGACNSEHLAGRQFSAAGGQLDFVRGAYASRGGRSIIACHSTAKAGTVSRITTRLDGPVTTPRNDTHIVVTEFGHADLKGLSTAGRAKALIGLAHPKFREELTAAAKADGSL
ncbi:MAG TPA: acetyl-CoA hydrolase/transferase C-terminal domain-containing protein [Caulobacter sp.]|nr:acetyl-CoA hydrolase/transferase C-terminal domain-containing protein [Caulobacter sp.]